MKTGLPEKLLGWALVLDFLMVLLSGVPARGQETPPNDNFADRIPITGGTLTIGISNTFSMAATGTLLHATLEPGEPEDGFPATNSVWWSWLAQSNGTVSLRIEAGSSTDFLTAVFLGSSVSNLTLVRSSAFLGLGGALRFFAEEGHEYAIQVRNPDTDRVGFSLELTQTLAPLNDDFAQSAWLVGNDVDVVGSTLGASREPGEPEHDQASPGKTTWWSWTAPSDGNVTVDVQGITYPQGPNLHPEIAVYQGEMLTNLALVASRLNRASLSNIRLNFLASAGTAYRLVVWPFWSDGNYTVHLTRNLPPVVSIINPPTTAIFLPGESVTVEAEADDPDGSITQVAFVVDTNLPAVVTSPPYRFVLSNVTYHAYNVVAVATDNGGLSTSAGMGIRVPPANDYFTNRGVIPPGTQVVLGTTGGASWETGEPDHAGGGKGPSVWWEWSAPNTNPVSILVDANGLISDLAVYTGTTVSNLSLVASSRGAIAQVTFEPVLGTAYLIAVEDPWLPDYIDLQLRLYVLQAGPCLDRVHFDEQGTCRFVLVGGTGQVFTVEATTDVAEWIPIKTMTNTSGVVEITDPGAGFFQRFYRAHRVALP